MGFFSFLDSAGFAGSDPSWAMAGNIFYVAGRFLIVLLMTRYFPSHQVGRVIYALAVVTPLSFLINMELRSVYVTDTTGLLKPGHCLTSRLISNLAGIAGSDSEATRY